MKEYFEAEMRLLQDAAQEFAEAYPEQAAMLNLKAVKDRDPYVERLLEGMAFLTAQIRERIDDGVPELSENLLDQLNPSLCRPFPSHTLVQVTPEPQCKQTHTLGRGTRVYARNIGPESVTCEYTTSAPVTVQPIEIESVSVLDRVGGGTQLRLTLRKQSVFDWADLNFTNLPLHLHCDRALAYALYEVCLHADTRVQLSLDTQPVPSNSAMTPGMMDPEDCLLPSFGKGHVAFSILHDYFNAREKYLFLDLGGFNSADWPAEGRLLTVLIDSPVTLPAGHHVQRDTFALNSVPAINLFASEAEPVRLTGLVPDYPLKVDHSFRDCANIYCIQSVSGRNPRTGQVRNFRPLQELRYRQRDEPTYATHTRKSGAGRRRTFVSVTGVTPGAEEVLSVDVLASNENYPRQYLDLHKLNGLHHEASKDLKVTNISRPSTMLTPPSMHDFQWQLISMMSLNLSKLSDAEHLKTLLSLFDWSDQVENQNRILAIEGVSTRVEHRIRQGILFQGLTIQLEVQESGFSSRSDLYMFGTVLHQFFANFANMTEYVETRLVSLPTYKEWAWKPTMGQRATL